MCTSLALSLSLSLNLSLSLSLSLSCSRLRSLSCSLSRSRVRTHAHAHMCVVHAVPPLPTWSGPTQIILVADATSNTHSSRPARTLIVSP